MIMDIKIRHLKEIAKEAYKNGCSDKTFIVAEKTVQYFRTISVKQGKINF